ncbi:MAG: PQQ-like beta-propeller repeat protein [Akkermansiaceae bacterium]|nr:PQQ-like beta-propeller repeat protein [Akkermansiaceae bacterium]
MFRSRTVLLGALSLAFDAAFSPVRAADWPMWRHDPGRTADTSEILPEKPALLWSRELPAPAPAYRDTRLRFDAAPEPIVVGNRIVVPSNSEDSVTAYNTATGEELWKVYTDGPVRFAPVADRDRVIFGSDDGFLYCVLASDGSPIWKIRAVPSERRVLGNGRLISVWPIRGGPVLREGRVYFAAGVWPLEGTFVFCVDAATGGTIWRNDRVSYLYGIHPHNAESFGGLAPQGYLLIDGEDLVVPSSQAYPARFDLKTGELKEFQLPAPGRKPGGWFASTPAAREEQKLKRRGLLFDSGVNTKPHEDKPWAEGLPEIRSTIRTANRDLKFADGLDGIDGAIHTMVAGDGRLFAVTTAGGLFAFGEKADDQPARSYPLETPEPGKAAAKELPIPLPQHGVAILLGLKNEARLRELAAVPDLHVIGIDSDANRVRSLRQQGWVGRRPHFIVDDPANVDLPPYLAELIVGEDGFLEGFDNKDCIRNAHTSLRPFGGMFLFKEPDRLLAFNASASLHWMSYSGDYSGDIATAVRQLADNWYAFVLNGPPIGSTNYQGGWAFSEDKAVRAPLGVLWYGDSIVHFKRSPQPKFIDGVMISNPKDWTDASTREGKVDYRLLETVFSDVYTGRMLATDEAPMLRRGFSNADTETIQPAQYRPPRQKDDWKPEAPISGDRLNPMTLEFEPRVFPKSYGCDGGVDYGLLYSMRSGTPAFYDKTLESGTINISGPRSGCTNSVIPANGVLNLPYFYEGCTCSYPLPMALALVSMPERFEQWAAWGPVEAAALDGKIQRIGLNFGAPGDRMTRDGTLWLNIPNGGGPSPEVRVTTEPPLDDLKTFYWHSLFTKTRHPDKNEGWLWVANSGLIGARAVTLGGIKPGEYFVRLFFTEPDEDADMTTRRFDVRIGEQFYHDGLNPFSRNREARWPLYLMPEVVIGDDGILKVTLDPENGDTVLCGVEIFPKRFEYSNHPNW